MTLPRATTGGYFSRTVNGDAKAASASQKAVFRGETTPRAVFHGIAKSLHKAVNSLTAPVVSGLSARLTGDQQSASEHFKLFCAHKFVEAPIHTSRFKI